MNAIIYLKRHFSFYDSQSDFVWWIRRVTKERDELLYYGYTCYKNTFLVTFGRVIDDLYVEILKQHKQEANF